MPIQVECPNKHLLRVSRKHAGKTGLCPLCRVKVVVPASTKGNHDGSSAPSIRSTAAYVAGKKASASGPPGLTPPPARTKFCTRCRSIHPETLVACPWCTAPLVAYRYFFLYKEGDELMARIIESRLVDKETVVQVTAELRAFMQQAHQKNLVLDFSAVAHLSHAMLNELLALQFSIENGGGRFRLCKIGWRIGKILAGNRLDHMFQIEGTGARAAKNF